VKKVAWGVLSTARIGIEKVIPGMRRGECCTVQAIASRSERAAREAARALGIPVAHGSYEALLADPSVEAIYNPLPNHLHVAWTLAAARAGKHVLCEKPISMTAEEGRALATLGGQVLIAEAFMVRFHPQWLRARDLVRGGALGTLRAVQVFFSYFNDDPRNIRNQPATGGGALYDIGCYAVVAGRFFLEAEARRAIALVDRDPALGTDRLTSALVDFGDGRRLDFTVSTQSAAYQRVHLVGTRGRLEIQIPFNAPQGAETRIFLDDGSSLDGRSTRTEILPPADQYALQCDAFARAIRGEAVLHDGVDDALRNMAVLDALFRSERSGRWEPVG
jgi:predicted dehydrogenase